MLWLGMILGCLVGFLLAWWFACKGSPLEPFFRRLLRLERNSASLNSRLILYDLQAGVEDLSTKVQRLDLGLQKLLDSIQEYQFLYKDSKKDLLSATGPFMLPEEGLEKKERRELLAKAIEELPESEKLILSLYYKEELTLKEIATVLKISTARVSQLHARTLRILRAKLKDLGYMNVD